MASRIDDLFQSPEFQNAPLGERQSMVAGIMDEGIYKARALGDTEVLDTLYKRKQELLTQVGMTRLPGDIGAVENFNNAAARSFSGFNTSIGLELLKQDHQAAKDYDEEVRRIYPVREEGISDDLGSATAQILPSALALGAGLVPGAAVPIATRIAMGSFYGAAAAGSKRGDIEEHEAITGEEVGSVRAGVSMAGAAMVELGSEMLGIEVLSRGATALARRGFNKAALDAVGAAAKAGDKAGYDAAIRRAFWEEPATRKATMAALGWAGAAGVEGAEEMVSQLGQNMTDYVWKPWDDVEPTKDVVASFKNGFVGGLLLGPLAMTVEGTRMSQFKDAQRSAEADELAALKLTDRDGNQIDLQHDPSAWDSPAFGSVKQRLGQAGLELYPVTGLPNNRGMMTRVDETGRRVILVDRKQAGDDAFYKVIGHEFGHGLDDLMGRESAVALKRSILEAVPEYKEAYQSALGKDADPVRDDLVVEEQFADLFAEHWLDPRLQQRVAELASEKPGKMGGLFASLKQKYSGQFSVPAERMRDMSREMARQAAEFAPGDPQHLAAQSLFEQANIAFEQGRKVEAALEQMAQMEAAMRLARRNQPDNLVKMRAEAQRILEEQKAAEAEAAKPKAEPKVEVPEPPMPPSPEPIPSEEPAPISDQTPAPVPAEPVPVAPAPAPAPAAPTASVPRFQLRPGLVFTPRENLEVDTYFDIVDRADVFHSEQPEYPTLLRGTGQNRMRNTRKSREAAQSLANEWDVRQLQDSLYTNQGSPIIAQVPSDKVTDGTKLVKASVSGTKRLMAYDLLSPKKKAETRAMAQHYADKLGKDISGMADPILVRVMNRSDIQFVSQVSVLSNKETVEGMSPAEQALDEGRALAQDLSLLRKFDPAGGNLNAQSNREFLEGYARDIAFDEGVFGTDRKTFEAVDRLQNALIGTLLAGHPNAAVLLRKIIEASGIESAKLSKIATELGRAAPDLLTLPGEFALAYDMAEGLNLIAMAIAQRVPQAEFSAWLEARRVESLNKDMLTGKSLVDPMHVAMAELLFNAAPGEIKDFATRYKQTAEAEAQGSLLGSMSREEAVASVRRAMARKGKRGEGVRLTPSGEVRVNGTPGEVDPTSGLEFRANGYDLSLAVRYLQPQLGEGTEAAVNKLIRSNDATNTPGAEISVPFKGGFLIAKEGPDWVGRPGWATIRWEPNPDEPRFSPAGRFTDPGSPTWRGGHLHSIRQARADLPDAEAVKQIALPPGVTFSGWDANGKGTMTYADDTTEEFQLGPDWREGITQAENRVWARAFSDYADPSVRDVLDSQIRSAAEAWYAGFRPRVAPEMRDAVQAEYDKALEQHARVTDTTLMRWMRSNVGRTLNNFVEDRLGSIRDKTMIRGALTGKAIQRAAKQDRAYHVREILRQVFPGRDLSQMTQALNNLAKKETELRAGVVVPIRQYVEKLPPVRDLDPSTMLRIAERIEGKLEEYRFTTPFSRDQRPWEEQKRVFIEEFLQDVRRGADQKLGFQDMYAYFDAMVRVIGTDHATYFRTGMGGGSINDNTQYAPDYAQGSGAASVVQDLMRAREEMTSEEEWAGAIAEAEAELTRDYGWTKQRVDEAVDAVIEHVNNDNSAMLLSLTRWMQEQDAPRMSPSSRLREIRTSEQIRAGNRGYSWAGYKARYQIPEGDAAKVARVWSELKFDDPGMTPEMREQMLRDWRFSGDFLRLADLVTARTILLRLADSAITDAEYAGTTATPEMLAAKNRAQLDFDEVADIQSAAGKTLRMANTQSVDTSLMPQLNYFQRFAKPINAVAAAGGKDAEIDAQLEAAKTLANVLGTETVAAIENDDLARDAELGRRTREAFASDDLDLQDKLIAELNAEKYRKAGEQFDVGDEDFVPPDDARLSPAPKPKFSAWLASVISDPARARRIHAAFQNNDAAYLANFTRLTDAQRGLLAQAAAEFVTRSDAVRASRKAQTTKANPGREAIADAAKDAAMTKAKQKRIAKLTSSVVRSANSEFTLRVARALPQPKTPMDAVNLALDNPDDFALAVERGAAAFRLKWLGKEVSEDDLAMGATILRPGLLDTKDSEGDVLRVVTPEELNFILRNIDNDVAANRARGFALAPVQVALGEAIRQAKISGDALRTGKFDRAAIIDAVMAQVSPTHQERVRPVAERELQIMTETANDAAYDRALAAAARADLRLRGLLAPVAKPEGAITPAEVARAIIAGQPNWRAVVSEVQTGLPSPAGPEGLVPSSVMLPLVGEAMEADKLTAAEFAALSPDSPRLAGIVGKLASTVSSDAGFVAFADAFVRNLHAQRGEEAVQRALASAASGALRQRLAESTVARLPAPARREAAVRRLLNDEALLTRVLEEQIVDLKRHGHEAYGMTPEQMQEHLDLVVNDLNLLRQRAVERAGLAKLVADAMAEAEITYRDIMLGGIRVHGQTMQSVGEAVAKRLGIPEGDVAARTRLNNAVQSLIDGNLATAKVKAKQRVLDAHTKDRKVRPESLPYEKLVGLWRMGFLDDTVALQTISAKLLGLPELTDAQIAEIRQIVNQIEVTLSAVGNDPTHVFVKMRWEALDRALSNWVDAFDTSLKGRAKDAFKVAQAAFTLNLVSGPGTLLVTNPLGNLGQASLELFMEANRQAKVGKLTTADYLKGVLSIAKDAATAAGASAVDAFTTGVVVERLGEKWDGLSVIERREFSGALKVLTAGGLIKYVGRVLAAGDTAFYAFAKDAGMFMNEMRRASEAGLSVEEAAAQARRNIGRDPGGMDKFMQQARDQAARAGVQGEAVIRQAATQLRDSALRAMPGGAESVERGNDMGRKSTYTHETDGFFSHFARKFLNPLLQELPVVRFVTPFTGIVATVADTSMEYFAPYAIYNVYKKRGHAAKILAGKTAEQLNDLDSDAYNEALRATQRAQQQMIIGTTTTLLAILAAALMGGDDDEEGVIIWGAGPKDFAKNAAWRETGARPYSIRIGGRVVSYQLSPLFLALAAVGNVRDARHYEVDPEVGLASVMLHSGLIATATTTTLDQSYLKGVSDLFEMLTERDRKRQSEKALELVSMVTTSTFIPFANAFRQTYKMIDPTGKVTNREFVKQTQAQMGPLSAGLTRRQNVLGSEVQFDRPIFDTLPFIATPDPAENEEDQRVLRFLASRDVWLSMPSSARTQLLVRGDVTKAEYKRLEATHGGAVMDEAQFYTFMKKRGERFKSAFTPLLATLEGADPELVKEISDRAMDLSQTQARREVLGLPPLAARDRALRQAIALRVREATR